MDEMDHLQEADAARQEARMADIRTRALADAGPPPNKRMCAECGCDIPAARLKAVPSTGFCIDCLEDMERRRR